jgi:hypothetical protein
MAEFTKHQAFSDELLPIREDAFKPEFRRDTLGRYFMQLPGYGKWMVSVEPGSKIISQGSEDEAGNPATDPGSLKTGSLSVNTTISVGDTIKIDGGTGCIYVGDYASTTAPSISLCAEGLKGWSGPDTVFAFFLGTEGIFGQGDVFIGDYGSNEYIMWDDSTGKLHVKGDLIIEGDIIGGSYPSGNYYFLDYSEGNITITGTLSASNVSITGGTVNSVLLTNLDIGSEPSIQGWTTDVVFTATDWNTISWTSGTIYMMDGTTFSVLAGYLDMNTDAVHYIYYNHSSTLATTTVANSAVGSYRLLMCAAKRGLIAYPTKPAVFQAFGTHGQGVFITADNIAANTITANEIYANTITAAQIHSDTITANEIASLNFLGKTAAFDTGTIGGWVISAACLTKDKDIGASGEARIQLCIGAGSLAGHLQAAYNHNRIAYPGFPHPNAPIDLVQITQGSTADPGGTPSPRVDIYRATVTNMSKKRMMLDAFGLHFYDENENSVGVITGNDAGTQTNFDIADISIANNTVRIFANGIRTAYPQPFSAADGVGKYFQMFCKTDTIMGGICGAFSAPTNNQIRVDNDGGGAIARFNGTPSGSWIPNHEYAFAVYGPLSLYTVGYDPGNTLGCIYYNTASNEVRVRINTGWVSLGAGGGGLPSGNDYDMLRCVSGTTWTATADVYWGSLSTYHLYRDPGGDTYFSVPGGTDYAFYRGGTPNAVIDNNFWTSGALYCYSALNFDIGGQISSNGSRITINKELGVSGSVIATGDIYAGSSAGSLIAGSSTGYVVCRSRYFIPVTGAFNAAKYYLREA